MPTTDDEGAPATTGELLALLQLEDLDRDLYRAHSTGHTTSMRFRLFGGQVAAQALRAATLTVDPERMPHSFHGYFLRPGRSDIPTILRVDRDRDGRSISARRVTAIQDGQVIFTMSASFAAAGGEGPSLGGGLPSGTPLPDDAGPTRVSPAHPAFELRGVSEPRPFHLLADVYWARPHDPLPDDPLVHYCALAYLSDMGVGEGELAPQLADAGQPSVDHAMWFHSPVRMDDWVLFAMRPVWAHDGRMLYTGSMYNPDGTLVATMIQECLIRPHPSGSKR